MLIYVVIEVGGMLLSEDNISHEGHCYYLLLYFYLYFIVRSAAFSKNGRDNQVVTGLWMAEVTK
jgi:hypothetical protein